MFGLNEKIKDHDNDYSKFEPFYSESMNLTLSIIIPVYNHPLLLENTLRYLLSNEEVTQNKSRIELIIINDGSKDDIGKVVSKFDYNIDLKYVSLSKNLGCSNARNVGINCSEGDVLFFLDSDIVIKKNYFSSQLRIHEKVMSHDEHALVVGLLQNTPIYSEDKIPCFEHVDSKTENDFRFNDNGGVWIPKRRKSRIMKETNYLKNFSRIKDFTLPEMVVGCSFSVERKIANRIGGFETSFNGWGLEDTYFGARAIGLGCFIIPSRNMPSFKIEHSTRVEGDRAEQCMKNKQLYNELLTKNSYFLENDATALL